MNMKLLSIFILFLLVASISMCLEKKEEDTSDEYFQYYSYQIEIIPENEDVNSTLYIPYPMGWNIISQIEDNLSLKIHSFLIDGKPYININCSSPISFKVRNDSIDSDFDFSWVKEENNTVKIVSEGDNNKIKINVKYTFFYHYDGFDYITTYKFNNEINNAGIHYLNLNVDQS